MEFTSVYRSKIIINAYRDWITASSRVLDIGCGNAIVTDQIKKYFHCFIAGTDVMDYRKREIPFQLMREKDTLPFKDKEFDLCMFNDALHHCRNYEGMLKEALRVAEKVLIFEMEPTIIAKVLDIFINQIHNRHMSIPLNIKTAEQWCDYFKSSNLDFEYRKIKKPSLFYPFTNFAFNLRPRV